MKDFTITVAYYDAWNEQTLVVRAPSIEEACRQAIERADGQCVDRYQRRSWDPGVTFVAGIAEGGDPDHNDAHILLDNVIGGPIPFEHSEEAALGAGMLLDALKAALPELDSELEQREQSGNGETVEPLRAIVIKVRTAIAGARR